MSPKRHRSSLAPLVIVALASAPLPAVSQQHAAHWTYEGENGPAHWASVEPEYQTCGIGKEQSPIDIRGAKATTLPPIEFDYQPSPLKIVDNGHTVQVTYAPGSYIKVGDRRYELQQFHFHHPAEEKVNGKSYPLVAHLVHKDAEGKLAVVAVLMTEGQANPFLETVWKYLPAEQGKEVAPEGVTIDASRLVPPSHGYYTFTGSLTTPPCSEGVTWFVLKSAESISKGEVVAFAHKYANNARPVQPSNGRVVQMTK